MNELLQKYVPEYFLRTADMIKSERRSADDIFNSFVQLSQAERGVKLCLDLTVHASNGSQMEPFILLTNAGTLKLNLI